METEIHFTKKDFHIDWFSGTGGGGQYRNKHQNCCRITHLATGLVASSTRHRERPSNQRDAFRRLVGKILAYYAAPKEERRRMQNVIRTYHFERNIATDGVIDAPIKNTMNGELNPFIENALNDKRPDRKTGRM